MFLYAARESSSAAYDVVIKDDGKNNHNIRVAAASGT